MANGYIETQERIADRWSRWSFEAAKVETCLRQTTEAEADRLHELIEEALSYESGLPFLALSDTVAIAVTPRLPKQPRYILSRSWADKHLNSDDDLKYFEGGAIIK